MKKYLAMALMSCALSAQANGYGENGNIMADGLDNNGSTWLRGMYSGYVWGIADTLELSGLVCIQNGVTRKQLVDVVIRYLAAHPEFRQLHAEALTGVALMEAFPCKKKGNI